MVKIKRGDHETLVSMTSYNTIFKPLGYKLVETTKKVETPKIATTKKSEAVKTVSDKKNKRQEEK